MEKPKGYQELVKALSQFVFNVYDSSNLVKNRQVSSDFVQSSVDPLISFPENDPVPTAPARGAERCPAAPLMRPRRREASPSRD